VPGSGFRPRLLGTRHRMARNEVHAFGHVGADVAHNDTFYRAHIGEDGAFLEMGCDRGREARIGPDRSREHDEIGVFHRRRDLGMKRIRETRFLRFGARLRPRHIAGDMPGQPPAPGGVGDGGADQSHANERDLVEYRSPAHLLAMNSRSAASAAVLASSLPTVKRMQWGSA